MRVHVCMCVCVCVCVRAYARASVHARARAFVLVCVCQLSLPRRDGLDVSSLSCVLTHDPISANARHKWNAAVT